MEIICVQLDIAWEDPPTNYAKVRALLEKTQPAPGDLVVLPEMFSTGFSMNVSAIHEKSPSETESFLAATAREYQVTVMGGLVSLAQDGRGLNQAAVYSPEGQAQALYTKLYPFTLGGETEHYQAGTEIVSFEWGELKACPFICYDLRFPEVFRTAAHRGAELFVVIANWPSVREHHWVNLLQARAIENLAYVVGVNRCGEAPKLSYSGRSLIIDPQGKILADAGNQESCIRSEVTKAGVMGWRREFPALADLRLENLRA